MGVVVVSVTTVVVVVMVLMVVAFVVAVVMVLVTAVVFVVVGVSPTATGRCRKVDPGSLDGRYRSRQHEEGRK